MNNFVVILVFIPILSFCLLAINWFLSFNNPDEAKISAIVAMPKPENSKQVQSFMGHCGYYRRFIFQYAYIARQPYALLVPFT